MVVMDGALVGDFLGERLASVLPKIVMRAIVLTVGTILTVVYSWRYWLP